MWLAPPIMATILRQPLCQNTQGADSSNRSGVPDLEDGDKKRTQWAIIPKDLSCVPHVAWYTCEPQDYGVTSEEQQELSAKEF